MKIIGSKKLNDQKNSWLHITTWLWLYKTNWPHKTNWLHNYGYKKLVASSELGYIYSKWIHVGKKIIISDARE